MLQLNFKICVLLKDLITPAVIISSLFVISKLLKTADPFSPKIFYKTQAPPPLLKQVFRPSLNNYEILKYGIVI